MSEARTPRAAGYVYVTMAEDGRPGLSAPEQRARIEELVADRGWELGVVAEDSGPTAGERGRLTELLEQAGDFDKLVVARIDRLGRMARRQHEAMERLHAGGVDVVGVEDDVEIAADAGPELLRMLALLAQWEPDRNPYAGMRPDQMRQRGFEPATVIDVGAGRGTRYLYLAFPDAHHVLLEPLSDFEPELRRQVAIRSGDILIATEEFRQTSARNILAGDISAIEERGAQAIVRVKSGVTWTVSVTRQAVSELGLQPGQKIWMAIKTHSCYLLEEQG